MTLLESIRTKEKSEQGGGLVPVTGGEDHVSEGVERGIYNSHCYAW